MHGKSKQYNGSKSVCYIRSLFVYFHFFQAPIGAIKIQLLRLLSSYTSSKTLVAYGYAAKQFQVDILLNNVFILTSASSSSPSV